jgi:PAS domain S-box-containing protein
VSLFDKSLHIARHRLHLFPYPWRRRHPQRPAPGRVVDAIPIHRYHPALGPQAFDDLAFVFGEHLGLDFGDAEPLRDGKSRSLVVACEMTTRIPAIRSAFNAAGVVSSTGSAMAKSPAIRPSTAMKTTVAPSPRSSSASDANSLTSTPSSPMIPWLPRTRCLPSTTPTTSLLTGLSNSEAAHLDQSSLKVLVSPEKSALQCGMHGVAGKRSEKIMLTLTGANSVASKTDGTQSHEFVTAMAETSPAMLWMGDEQGKCVFLNAALRSFWGVNPTNFSLFDWTSTLHPDDIAHLGGPFAKAMAEHTSFDVQARYRRFDGAWRTMSTIANPRFDDTGHFLGMTGVNIDITEQLLAEEHNRLLMGELNHRTKNILSVVQAIARQTSRSSPPEHFLRSFGERLQSLSASNDLLLRTDWSGVQLNELVAAQLGPLIGLAADRVNIGGPAIRIGSREAQTLGMALHELSTNSLKYGAFAEPYGKVALTWRLLDESRWQLEWREATARPPVPTEKKGFGHTVTVDMIASTLSALVTVEFPITGFVWRIVVPKLD